MKLLIKQRVFSWNDTYDVFDEFQNPKYSVRSEFFSIGHVIHILLTKWVNDFRIAGPDVLRP